MTYNDSCASSPHLWWSTKVSKAALTSGYLVATTAAYVTGAILALVGSMRCHLWWLVAPAASKLVLAETAEKKESFWEAANNNTAARTMECLHPETDILLLSIAKWGKRAD